MINTIRKKIAFRILDRFFRQKRSNIVDFKGGISRASRFLVHLPDTCSEEEAAFIEDSVKAAFPESEVCFLVVKKKPSSAKKILNDVSHSEKLNLLKIDTEKVNFIFAPDKQFLKHLTDRRFDIALDLQKEFSLVSAYALNASGAYLVVGPLNEKYENFYNLQIKVGADQDLHRVFLENLKQLIRNN